MAVLALKQLYYNPDNSTDFHSMYRVRFGKIISQTVLVWILVLVNPQRISTQSREPKNIVPTRKCLLCRNIT